MVSDHTAYPLNANNNPDTCQPDVCLLQSRGADPTILSENFEPYLSPGKKSPVEVATEDEDVRDQLRALEKLYAGIPKSKEPHPDIGCWQTLYDYGQEVKSWAKDYRHPYPGYHLQACQVCKLSILQVCKHSNCFLAYLHCSCCCCT